MTEEHRVVVVGAGFSGIGMAARLRSMGIDDFVLLDRGNDLGGTWRDNSYPGAACDVPSDLYSYSFALNPDWTRAFPSQGEIWDYLRHCAGPASTSGATSASTRRSNQRNGTRTPGAGSCAPPAGTSTRHLR